MPDLKQIFLYANVESGRLTDSEEYSLGYKYLLKFSGANGFKFKNW